MTDTDTRPRIWGLTVSYVSLWDYLTSNKLNRNWEKFLQPYEYNCKPSNFWSSTTFSLPPEGQISKISIITEVLLEFLISQCFNLCRSLPSFSAGVFMWIGAYYLWNSLLLFTKTTHQLIIFLWNKDLCTLSNDSCYGSGYNNLRGIYSEV